MSDAMGIALESQPILDHRLAPGVRQGLTRRASVVNHELDSRRVQGVQSFPQGRRRTPQTLEIVAQLTGPRLAARAETGEHTQVVVQEAGNDLVAKLGAVIQESLDLG